MDAVMEVIVYKPFLVRSMRDLRVIKLSCSSQILHGFRRSEKYHTNKISGQRIHPNEVIYCIFSFPKWDSLSLDKYVFFFSFHFFSSFLSFFIYFFLRRAVPLLRFRIECDGNKCRMRVVFTNWVFSIISASRNITPWKTRYTLL